MWMMMTNEDGVADCVVENRDRWEQGCRDKEGDVEFI